MHFPSSFTRKPPTRQPMLVFTICLCNSQRLIRKIFFFFFLLLTSLSAARWRPVKSLRLPAASSKGRRRRRRSALPRVRSARVSVRRQHKHYDTLYLTAVSIELQSGAFYRRGARGLGGGGGEGRLGVGQGRGGDGPDSSWLTSLSAGGG